MKILYAQNADLLQTSIHRYIHGCNAQGVMGSGVAGLIRKSNPEVYEVYRKAYEDNGNHLDLGDVIWARYKDGTHVVGNLISQEHFGRGAANGEVYVSYDAIEMGFIYLNAFFEGRASAYDNLKMEQLAMPLIGAGLAGGSWKRISSIIEARTKSFQPVVYLLDDMIPTS